MKLPRIADIIYTPDCNTPLNYGDKYIYTGIEGDEIINRYFEDHEPCLIARYGSVELATIREFKRHKQNHKIDIFSNHQRYSMQNSAGFFPTTNKALTRFACELIDVSSRIDLLGCWYRPYEKEMCINYLPKSSKLVHLNNICPISSPIPWSNHLKGKNVLVIHPFDKLIKEQYKKRNLLFSNNNILPDFNLITYKPVQSIADNYTLYNFQNWFEALNYMKQQIKNIDFDIALIGAGAYGIFLGDYCKSLGKKSIHIGGATQLLFGIKGKRWDNCNFYNDYWIRASDKEKPLGVEKLENGTFAYW